MKTTTQIFDELEKKIGVFAKKRADSGFYDKSYDLALGDVYSAFDELRKEVSEQE